MTTTWHVPFTDENVVILLAEDVSGGVSDGGGGNAVATIPPKSTLPCAYPPCRVKLANHLFWYLRVELKNFPRVQGTAVMDHDKRRVDRAPKPITAAGIDNSHVALGPAHAAGGVRVWDIALPARKPECPR